MKCNRLACYGWKSTKSREKGKLPIILGSIPFTESPAFSRFILEKNYSHCEPCGGDIISEIELEMIPYFGGADPSVEIRFRCNNCGHEFSGENGLPSDISSLNEFLTEILSKI